MIPVVADSGVDNELELMTAMVVGLRSQLAPLIVRRMEQGAARTAPSDRLTIAQRLTLNALVAGPLAMSDLAQRTGVAVSTATRMVQRLERMGLVERAEAPAAGDRRRRYIGLTDEGRDVAHRADELLVERMRVLLAPLSPQRRRDLVAGMEAMIEAFQLADRSSTSRASSSASDGDGGDSGGASVARMPSSTRPR